MSSTTNKTERKIKVLHIGKYYWDEKSAHRGGIETHLEILCNHLQESLTLSILVSNDKRRTEEISIGKCKLVKAATAFHCWGAPVNFNLIHYICSLKPDIIHLHLPNPLSVISYLFSFTKARLVLTHHSDVVRQHFWGHLFEPILKIALNQAAAIIVASQAYLDSSSTLAQHKNKTNIIPYGIETFKFDNPDQELVSRIKQRFGEKIVLAVGRLVYYKGFEYLIRAMQKIKSANLVILGEGPLKSKLQKIIIDCDLKNRTHLLGVASKEELKAFYHACDVFVLPSVARSEAFGIVQLEAMACGKPVINTCLDSGVPHVSIHQETGLTVPPKDVTSLATAIDDLLQNNDSRIRFGETARQRVNKEFTATLMAKKILNLYQDVIRN